VSQSRHGDRDNEAHGRCGIAREQHHCRRNAESVTHDQRDCRDEHEYVVTDRIEQGTHFRDHIPTAGKKPVQEIGDSGDANQASAHQCSIGRDEARGEDEP
jgi:hypothetical protein